MVRTLDLELLESFANIHQFLENYENILYNTTVHFDSFYQNAIVYTCYLKYNRKVEFSYTLDEFETISKVKDVRHLPEKCEISVFKLSDDYKQTKEANYLRELKQLKEKYNKIN